MGNHKIHGLSACHKMRERPVAYATMKCNLKLEDQKGKVEKLSTVEDVLPGQSFEEFTHGHKV